jgi:hypothetical protein
MSRLCTCLVPAFDGGIYPESFWFFCPGFGDEFVWCQAFDILDLGNINVEAADGVGLERLLAWLVSLDIRYTKNAMTLGSDAKTSASDEGLLHAVEARPGEAAYA